MHYQPYCTYIEDRQYIVRRILFDSARKTAVAARLNLKLKPKQ